MTHLQKDLKDYTFDELVKHCQGDIILSIPVGDFNYGVWRAMELALRWKAEQDKKPFRPDLRKGAPKPPNHNPMG